jgi:hypothetical protein
MRRIFAGSAKKTRLSWTAAEMFHEHPRHAICAVHAVESAHFRDRPCAPFSTTCISAKRCRCQHREYTSCQSIGDGSRGKHSLARLCIPPHRYGTCLRSEILRAPLLWPVQARLQARRARKGTAGCRGVSRQARQEIPCYRAIRHDSVCHAVMGEGTSWEVPAEVNGTQ